MTETRFQNQPDYVLPLVQAILFVGSVYLQKFARKSLKLWSKQYKEVSRILFVTVLTLLLAIYNYSEKCEPFAINLKNCFYFHFDFNQCMHVIVANTILFGYHIYRMYGKQSKMFKDSPMRKLVFAPLLEQILFRAIFYRSSGGNVSITYLSAIFAIAHLHRHIRKAISGKNRKIGGAIFQLIFTFIFSLYCYFFLDHYQSIIPCIILHIYCNMLGAPTVSGKYSLICHFICLVAFSAYLINVVK